MWVVIGWLLGFFYWVFYLFLLNFFILIFNHFINTFYWFKFIKLFYIFQIFFSFLCKGFLFVGNIWWFFGVWIINNLDFLAKCSFLYFCVMLYVINHVRQKHIFSIILKPLLLFKTIIFFINLRLVIFIFIYIWNIKIKLFIFYFLLLLYTRNLFFNCFTVFF